MCFNFGNTRIVSRGALLVLISLFSYQAAQADIVNVTFTNNAPYGGIYLTPAWIGFHNGSFDSYDGGTASSVQLSRLAEDGNVGPISQTFANNGTLVATGVTQTGTRQQGVFFGSNGVIAPGESVSRSFNLDLQAGGANQFLSYASMVLPTNDYYIANGNPTAWDLSGLYRGQKGSLSFDIFSVNDAGTEVNDFAYSAGNGLFPQLGLPVGQSGPNQGTDENGVNANVLLPFAGFSNSPSDADTNPAFGALNFTNASLYPRGLATITIARTTTAVPEPGSLAILGFASLGLVAMRRRR